VTDEFKTAEFLPHDASAAPDSTVAQSPMAVARGLLRGRWLWAIGIGGVLASAGAWIGFRMSKPTYRSAGLIDIAPQVPRILYQTEEKGVLPMFESYVQSQEDLAKSRRVIDMAMQSAAWKGLGRGISDSEIASFMEHLSVDHRSQSIQISFSDLDPDAAMIAVNQIIEAYMKLTDERDHGSGLTTRQELEKNRTADINRLNAIKQDELSITGDLGAEALEASYSAKTIDMNRYNAEVADLDMQIEKLKNASDDGDAAKPLTPQVIAKSDETMAKLLRQQAEAEDEVRDLVEVQQLGPKADPVAKANVRLELAKKRIADYLAEVRNAMPDPVKQRERALRDLIAKRTGVAALRDAVLDDVKRLAKQRLQLGNLASEKKLISDRLDEVKQREEQIKVESAVHGRASVVSYGDRPVAAERDRRYTQAGEGGLLGLLTGFGIVLLWGLRESRVRHITDVHVATSAGRFLGVVPEVKDERPDAEGESTPQMGDYCVHHIRSMLQLRSPDHKTVVALTSPSPGAGKTTLSLALGMSFAATGSRTLLIDCDFIGHGMTSAMRSLVCEGTCRAILALAVEGADRGQAPAEMAGKSLMAGLLAARRLTFDDGQVDELLSVAKDRAAAGDEAAGNRKRALEALARTRPPYIVGQQLRRGVLGALDGRPIRDCVVETDVPNLAVLPVGDATEEDAKSLSRVRIQRLVEACREEYDTILIDSGPVLGSIEATFAAAAANEVLLIVSSGERRGLVDEARERIERIGANLAGVIFNRASNADVRASSYASRSKSRRSANVA